MKKESILRLFNAVAPIVFMGIITAAFYQEFFYHEKPCPLCYLQRLAMMGVSISLLMNLRFGLRVRHYAYALGFVLFGGVVALRQICLHICPGFPTFGFPVWGLSLYTWSLISFALALLGIIVLLFFHSEGHRSELNLLDKVSFLAVLIVVLCNIVAVSYQCHLGHCKDVPWPQKNTSAKV